MGSQWARLSDFHFHFSFADSSVSRESACNAGDPWFDFWIGKIHWRRDRRLIPVFLGFPCGSAGKESTYNVGDLGLIPGLGRSLGERKGYPLQYSVLENSMDCIVHGVTWLSDFHFHFVYKEIRSLSDMSYNSFSQFVIYLLTLRYFSLPEILHGNIVKFIIICPHWSRILSSPYGKMEE